MYSSFFGLNEKPFSITPDPRYLYMSQRHTEALAHLIYGVKETGGFIQLTGEVGTGKTTLVRSLLQQLPEKADVALVLNSQLSKIEFLASICEELDIPAPQPEGSTKALTDALNDYLLANHSMGRRTILIVDEAQNLQPEVLEQVRLLTNLETTKQKLLQIILIGQPELRELLSRNDMRQLAQRITGRYHLEPLTQEETNAYIEHRLKVAGCTLPVFSGAAKKALYRISKGIPRIINVVADRALLGAFTRDLHQVSPAQVKDAAAEVYDKTIQILPGKYRLLRYAAVVISIVLVSALTVVSYQKPDWELFGGSFANNADTGIKDQEQPIAPLVISDSEKSGDVGDVQATIDPAIVNPVDTELPGLESVMLEALLEDNRAHTSNASAFATLFDLWNVDFVTDSVRACQQATAFNLYCLFQRGSLAQIRVFDRPAILTLRDAQGNQHQIVLSGLDGELASISIDKRPYQVETTELTDLWFGEYLILWRPGIGEKKALSPGMQGHEIMWLRESLAKIRGEQQLAKVSDLYDKELENIVRAYQRERRLTVDGLVGQETQIAINTDLRIAGIPRLVHVN